MCSPGATSTIPTPAARRCTPTSSCAAGPRPAWRSRIARRRPSANPPAHVATATTWSAAGAGTPCFHGPSPARSDGRWADTTPWWRSGTASRGSHPCGAARRGSRSSITSTGRCGTRSCRARWPSFGRTLEARLAPPFYRRGLTATPSDATRDELLELGFHPDRVTAIPNGTDPKFSPGGSKTVNPSILAVGRLAPVKRFELLIDSAVTARRAVPGLTLTIVGEGPERDTLADLVARHRRRRLDPLRRAGRP